MAREEKKEGEIIENKWGKATIMAIVIVFLDIFFLYLGTSGRLDIIWSVGSVGIITFFGILMLANYLSVSKELDKGEVRKAITGSFIAVYFTLVSLLTFTRFSPSNAGLAKTMISHFTYVIGIIIVFYFGSSSVRRYLEIVEERQKSKEKQQQAVSEEKK